MCETKNYPDGIYEATTIDTAPGYIIDGQWHYTRNGAPVPLERYSQATFRRIADLDGKPVVDEGVVEKLATAICDTGRANTTYHRDHFLDILRKHLSPSREQGAEGSDDDSPAFKRASKQLRDMCNVKRLEMAMTTLLATIDGNTNQHGIVQFSSLADSVGEARTALERAKSSEEEREQRDAADRANAADMANLREGCITTSNKLADVEAERDRLKRELGAAVEYHGRWINKLCALLPGFQRHSGDLLHNVCCEIGRLQARIAELEAKPSTATHREIATGDGEVEIPQPEQGDLKGICERLRMLWKERDEYGGDLNLWTAYCRDIRKTLEDHLETITDALLATPLPEPAEGPIVAFPGAFPCWWKDGIVGDYTAWPSCDGVRYMRNDGHASGWMQEWDFECNFTRTPPSPLPPEQERLVGPIATYFKVD